MKKQKIKFFKCKHCGEKVFKKYWNGIEEVREHILFYNSTKPHTCNLTYPMTTKYAEAYKGYKGQKNE